MSAYTAFVDAVFASWEHIERCAVHRPPHGFQRHTPGDPPCPDPAEHARLLEAEGEAWAAFRASGDRRAEPVLDIVPRHRTTIADGTRGMTRGSS